MKTSTPAVLVSLVLVTLSVGGCGNSDRSTSGTAVTTAPVPVVTARLEITAVAGPVCPVESDPPDPECAPRPVAGAVMTVTRADGSEVARGATEADGRLVLDVPVGDLIVVPQPVEGLLGTAAPIAVTAVTGQSIAVTADYDTGIR